MEKQFMVLHHDNAPTHTVIIIRQYFKNNQVSVVQKAPQSPDMASCDFSLFPRLKLSLQDMVLSQQKPNK